MLRTAAFAQERPWLLLGIVFLATLLFGFVTQAAGSAYLNWRADPIVLHYRTTLSYTSALVGDAILLPIVNVFMTSQLAEWRRRTSVAEIVPAVLMACVMTVGVHLYQAANALLNWTMQAPYAWTPLGYAHGLFMFGELSLVVFFWGQVALVTSERRRALVSHRVLLALLCSLVFMRLLLGDYGYFA